MSILLILLLAMGQRKPMPPKIVGVRASTVGTCSFLTATYPQLSKGTTVAGPDGTILDTRTLTNYGGGQYLVWNLSGHVVIRATALAGPNVVISGIFIGPQRTPIGQVQYVKTDITTSGSWKTVFGGSGYAISGDQTSFPTDVVFSQSGQQTYTWADPSTDSRSLQKAIGTARIMSGWYNSTFKIDLTISGTQAREVALYVTDYDSGVRQSRFDVSVPGGIQDTTPWLLTGWELGAFDGSQLVNSLPFDTFPSDNSGVGQFAVIPTLFPVAGKNYNTGLRYRWITSGVDPSLPAIVAYTPWTIASGGQCSR